MAERAHSETTEDDAAHRAHDAPDTVPDPDSPAGIELVEAIEWLRKAGIVSAENKPAAFAAFFEEAAE